MQNDASRLKRYSFIIVFLSIALFFSFWLIFHTFSYRDGSMLIASKAWSDFASHIPLIRSFSLGDNFPPEYPLFPGEPIRYHFLFYAFVGLLERIGARLDYALNIPSALSFTALIVIIYFFAKTFFESRAVGILSVVFFLFNGSLSFLEFFKIHPLSTNILTDIISNNVFPSFGPYDGKIVSAFWNLNIYTNQRHLALPLALLLFVTFFIVRSEKEHKRLSWSFIVIFAILVGTMSLSHSSIFIMFISVLAILFFLLPRQRLAVFLVLVFAGLISLPRVYFLGSTATFIPHLQFGYIIINNISFESFVTYWITNFGIASFLIPVGFVLSSGLARKALLAFFSLFIIGNTIQFSPEIAANHKFFNAFLIVGNMFAAFTIVKLWKLKMIGKVIVPLLLFFMILSGVIDFFPIKNDRFIELADYPKNSDIVWIMENTPREAIFLNSSYLYHPASLAGRKIFLGWPYFPWSLGYDTIKRDNLRKSLLLTSDATYFCGEVKKYNISYVVIDDLENIPINRQFLEKTLTKMYENGKTQVVIYKTKLHC